MPSIATPSSTPCPLPSPGQFLSTVSSSCTTLAQLAAPDISINSDAISTFVEGLDRGIYEDVANQPTVRLPLKFESVEQECNVMGLIGLLGFGSGWDDMLGERDAGGTVLFGVMSMHISATKIDGEYMSKMGLALVSELFNIPLTRDVPHATLPITLTEPHPLRKYAEQLLHVINETGTLLKEKGYRNLGHFILDAARQGSMDALVEALVTTIPSLRDMERWGGVDIYFFRRAQLIALHTFHILHCHRPSSPFPPTAPHTLTLTPDPALLSHLIFHNIVTLSPTMQTKLAADVDMTAEVERWDLRLRAVGVEAGRRVVQAAAAAGVGMSAGDLEAYLRRVGSQEEEERGKVVGGFGGRESVFY
ncbi:uncharacterized protein EV422DRAFT_576937 [Fimicolochytrium jonesii]|uniref:uncharacterized protein n=1 Tax=Fimicolochytrium jonesii TaxID=1396493 RepID=UPI0022FF27F8|nr:uncharacterized protein EV422DRAFT_576937 [Fimicolochytrium jonesii]KAI8823352.1 hypothetical protein EV422DRAFT_576937 [Fimicolochytrium jonesii]